MDITELPKDLMKKVADARKITRALKDEIVEFIENDKRLDDWDDWEKSRVCDFLMWTLEGAKFGEIESGLQWNDGAVKNIFKEHGISIE